MRVTVETNITISDDTAGKEVLFGLDSTGSLAKEIADNYERCVSGKFTIAAAGTENLPLGDITAVLGIMVIADDDFNYVLNAGADPVIVCARAGTVAASKCRVLMQAAVSQFAITNPNATALTGTWVAWGDLTV